MHKNKKLRFILIFVTGGCGFIGTNFSLSWLKKSDESLIVFDKLTYAGLLSNLDSEKNNSKLQFVQGDLNDSLLLSNLFEQYKPCSILNFAAETHVDRSISDPKGFIQTNINGTFNLLETAKKYWRQLKNSEQERFRFLQVSTDEIYGTLKESDPPFTEESPYQPNNPYSASKAAADHLVRSYFHTYGLPTLITHCSNNYGPFQFPEKLIPFTILNALQNKPLLIYGDGLQIRDWLFVNDHCDALREVLKNGKPGETYNIGGNNEKTNLEVVKLICHILDTLQPAKNSYAELITHIKDRPGHDRRYAIDTTKISQQLNWQPTPNFEQCMKETIEWYLNNKKWIYSLTEKEEYQAWLQVNYKNRECL